MALQILLLAAGVAFAAPAPKPKAAPKSAEDALSVGLSRLRQKRSLEMRRAVLGGAEDLRDAVAAGSGAERKRLAARLPGMAVEPYDICRDLGRCREAPQSLHVEEHFLADDAFRALARPWIKLQEARGKAVKVVVDPGAGVRLELEDLPRWPVVTLSAEPAPTGGFDIVVEDGVEASRAFAVERASVLSRKP
jgi:hypothetical protein